MYLPNSCELDPDGDLILILLDHGDTDQTLVNHVKNSISISHTQNRIRTKRSLSGRSKNVMQVEETDAVAPQSSAEVADNESREIRFKVSSKHLSLVSPVFKALLRGGFAEGQKKNAGMLTEVRLHDDNPAALWLLLLIIHGQPKKVPASVSLETLIPIAILVDKYELHDVAEVTTDVWFSSLEKEVMSKDDHCFEEIVQLVCISWVFRKPDMFFNMTHMTMLYSVGSLESEEAAGLPIPAVLLEKIEHARTKAIRLCIEPVQTCLTQYSKALPRCRAGNKFDCDATVLGGLAKGLAAEKLYPVPTSPYKGISFAGLSKSLKKMTLPSMCGSLQDQGLMRKYDGKPCGIKAHLHKSVREAGWMLEGLKLD